MGELTYTLQQLRRDVCTELQMPFFRRYNGPLQTDASSTVGKIIDSALRQGDDFWTGHWFYHVSSQQARLITTFNANEDALFLESDLASIATNDYYEIHSIWNAYDIHRAINRAIEMDGRNFFETTTDETLVLEEDQLIYSLTGLTKKPWKISKIWIERERSVLRGNPTSAGASSLTDTRTDFAANGVDSTYLVSIYAGKGSGQLRNVSSLTGTTQINVSVAWTTQPDTTSKYALWKPDHNQNYDWFRVTSVRFDAKEFPDIMYLRNRFVALYGMRIRLEYLNVPLTLSLETDATVVPKEYIIARACSLLHGQAIGDNRYNRDLHYAESERYRLRADDILARHHPATPEVTVWTDSESTYPDQTDPLGWYSEASNH